MSPRGKLARPSRTDTLIQYGTICARLVRDLGDATNLSYLKAVAGVSLVIMETVQTVRRNKDQCYKLTERAYELICAIVNVCRDTEVQLAPAMVRSIEQFTETLTKILEYMQRQVKGGFWRRVVRHVEDAGILEECNSGLTHALNVFGVQTGIIAAVTMAEMKRDAEKRHDELMTIIASRPSSSRRPPPSHSDNVSQRSTPSRSSTMSTTSSRSSTPSLSWSDASSLDETEPPATPTSCRSLASIDKIPGTPTSYRSQVSIRKLRRSIAGLHMLPASPKIFKGRDGELSQVIDTLKNNVPARIALLGEEGVGKTSLALHAIHHPEVQDVFSNHCYFVACKSGGSALEEYLTTMSDYFGLEPSRRLSKSIIRHLTNLATPTLLVLDNFDCVWDSQEQRPEVEEFLSLLTDIKHLSIIITMRGTKRPRQILWSRPFLSPLKPLSSDAAREAFLDISDVSPDDPQLGELICLAENHPKKLTIMASLASFEGCASLVTRWRKEGPLLLSEHSQNSTVIEV